MIRHAGLERQLRYDIRVQSGCVRCQDIKLGHLDMDQSSLA